MGSLMNYSDGLVYFIDILGSKNRSFNELYKINKLFHNELNNVKKRHNPSSVGQRFVNSFSDCAYIVYSLNGENNIGDNLLQYLYTSLYNTCSTISLFTLNGFLCRGGISYGEVYFDKETNIIFGPSVNRAYLLESEQAIMPRIIIEYELAIKILDYDAKIKLNNELSFLLNGNIILKDEIDNKYFLNYLNCFSDGSIVLLGDDAVTFEVFYQKSKEFSKTSISNSNNYNIISKHNWHLNYLEKIKNLYDNTIFISGNEIAKILIKK
jgi:hypothetical protein